MLDICTQPLYFDPAGFAPWCECAAPQKRQDEAHSEGGGLGRWLVIIRRSNPTPRAKFTRDLQKSHMML